MGDGEMVQREKFFIELQQTIKLTTPIIGLEMLEKRHLRNGRRGRLRKRSRLTAGVPQHFAHVVPIEKASGGIIQIVFTEKKVRKEGKVL